VTKNCKDCGPGALKRPAPHPGPRCATHHRERKKAARSAAHESRVGKVYGLKPGQYEAIYEAQDGCCYICTRAVGKAKKLSVDHDHKTGYVRGLLCTTCNNMLGHARDEISFFGRAVDYLTHPPAQEVGVWARPEVVVARTKEIEN